MLVFALSIVACGQKADADTEKENMTEMETETEVVEMPVTPGHTNLLTGLATLTDEAVGKRPVAVMVNNTKASFPQYGIAQADIIFEVPVEGAETRFMAMYGDYTQVPKICSVRSCRMYFPEFSDNKCTKIESYKSVIKTVSERKPLVLGNDGICAILVTHFRYFDQTEVILDDGEVLCGQRKNYSPMYYCGRRLNKNDIRELVDLKL